MDPDQEKPVQPVQIARWIKWCLGLSLALNLAVVGVIVGALLRDDGPRRGPGGLNHAMPYMRALPPEDRKSIRQAMRSGSQHPGMSRRALHTQMIEALKADPFDASRVQDIVQAQLDEGLRSLGAVQQAWLDHVTEMDAQSRRMYADRIEDALKRPRGKPPKGDR